MKKKSAWLWAGLLMAGAGGWWVLAEEIELGVMLGDRVNVRARPLGTAEICCQLRKDDLVEILERRSSTADGGGSTNAEEWVRIVLPEQAMVWIQTEFLTDVNGRQVTRKRVNGRAGPGLAWPPLCLLDKEEEVTVRTNAVEWAGVAPSRKASGWVAGRFVGKSDKAVVAAPLAEKP
ncbi:MAG: hypothetical protein PHV34_00230 [Verrucomicrobiae bacterium]|nr:hypothetical protein [Verrucomicrobiae bacterium]